MNESPRGKTAYEELLLEDSGQFKCPGCGEWHVPDGSPEPVLCKPSDA